MTSSWIDVFVKRVLPRAVTMIFVTMCFAVMVVVAQRSMPGDPTGVILGQHAGGNAAQMEPFIRQMTRIMGGDLGTSLRYPGVPVSQLLFETMSVTAALAALSWPVAVVVGILWAAASVALRRTILGAMFTAGMVLGIALPEAAFAITTIMIMAVELHWLPTGGWGTASQAVMPVLVLVLPSSAYLARLARTALLELERAPIAVVARSKGLSEWRLVMVHLLPLAAAPILSASATMFGGMLGGTFAVETIFSIPGVGRLMVESVNARDYTVVSAIALLGCITYSFITIAMEFAGRAIDPRKNRQ